MPANLTPMYLKAEREYRRAQTNAERLECLQRMLQLIPKHKGTEKLQADIKSRLKEFRSVQQQQSVTSKDGRAFRIPRQGAGRVVIVGAPNGGKSRILGQLTRASPEIAPFPFTTREPMPAMTDYRGVPIQLVDTPPVTMGQLEPWMLNLVRTADGALLVIDGASDDAVEETAAVIHEFCERKTRFSAHSGFDPDSFAVVNISTTIVVTHAADPDSRTRFDLLQETSHPNCPVIFVELDEAHATAALQESVFRLLDVIRIFTKPPGQPPDLESPLTVSRGGTVEDLALQVHEELAERLQHARLWRDGVHDGQMIGRDYVLRDGDVIELH